LGNSEKGFGRVKRTTGMVIGHIGSFYGRSPSRIPQKRCFGQITGQALAKLVVGRDRLKLKFINSFNGSYPFQNSPKRYFGLPGGHPAQSRFFERLGRGWPARGPSLG